LYSAVGDAFAGRRLGFGRRRAALAARFARHRGAGDVAANWVAGALAEIGLIAVVVPADAAPGVRLHLAADAPLHGAHLLGSLVGVPAPAADIVRWHREHDDGTGVPDRLRWDGIPADAAALGIAHAFLEAVEDPQEPRDPAEAVFSLSAESGRRFRIELLAAFRSFFTAGEEWDAPLDLRFPELDEEAALVRLAARIDARDPASEGRSERLATLAGGLAPKLGLDPARAMRLARLVAVGRAADTLAHDDFDPLSRFAREQRTEITRRAAAIAASVPGYAADAPVLADSGRWFEDGAQDPLPALLSLAVVATALRPAEAARRLAAAAGSQLDPDVTRAYLTALGAPT
jgi:hypothetical protein